jgi:integrase
VPKLTKKFIDSQHAAAGDVIIFDTEIRGFGLKIAPSGRKTFFLKYRNASGRQRKPTIGTFGDLTVDQARKIAADWKADIAAGGDPSAEKQSARKQQTLNEFADGYFTVARKKASTIGMERSYYETHVRPSLGKLALGDITKKDIQSWINTRSKTPGAANRTVSMLSAIFNEAERLQQRDANSNPCVGVKKYPAEPRERYLSRDEFQRLEATLDQIEQDGLLNYIVAPAIRFALLTGARRGEFLSLKWEYVDFTTQTVNLPDSKTGPRKLYLSEPAVALLRKLPRIEGNPYVFPGHKSSDHFRNLKKPFKRVLELAGIKNFRIHDLRHTHASWGVLAGLPTNMIAKTLGHAQARTAERYAHIGDEPALRAAEMIGREMARHATAPPTTVAIDSAEGGIEVA